MGNRSIVAIILAIGALALVGCGSSGSSSTSSNSGASSSSNEGGGNNAAASGYEGKTIGYIQPGPIPTFIEIGAAVKKWAEANGMQYTDVVTPGVDVGQQVSAFQTLLSKNVDAIITPPLSGAALQPMIDRAHESGIAVGTLPAFGTKKNLTWGLYNDFETAAVEVVKLVAEELEAQGRECTVAIMAALPAFATTFAIQKGYEAGIEAAGCELVDTKVDAPNTTASQTTIGNGWKTQFGSELGAALVVNGNQGAVMAGLSGGGFEPLIVDTGSENNTIKLIREGKIFGDLGFPGVNYGEAAAYAMAQAIAGEEVPQIVYGGVPVLTKENVDKFITDEEQLEAPPIEEFEWIKKGGKTYYEPEFFKK